MIERFKIVYFNSRQELTDGDDFHSTLPEINADLASWVKQHCGDGPVILIDARITLPDYWQSRLLSPFNDETVTAVSALTCADYRLSPLPAHFEFPGSVQALDAALSVLSPAQTYLARVYNPALLALTDVNQLSALDAVHITANLLVQADDAPMMTRYPDIGDQHPLPAHPMAAIQWLISQQPPDVFTDNDYPLLNNKPNLLHVVMDWGGGVHQWLKDYITTDAQHNHFVLVSEGEFFRQSYGEKFRLHYGGVDGLLLARFECAPSIDTVAISHQPYRDMLSQVQHDYAIGGLMVSSLIGHSMDCLSTGLPTVRVLHDYFPHWPALVAQLDQDTLSQADIRAALAVKQDSPFSDVDEQQVRAWQQALNQKLSADRVQIVAPNQSVLDNIRKLDHSQCYQKARVIPHGVTTLLAIDYQAEHKPFTVLVLGRLITGKGKQLLQQVMAQAELADIRWVLLGCGDDGDDFKPSPQLTVIKEYQRDQLPALVSQYAPQLALMPAVVSETFSYVLSELQMLAVPVLATRTGALKNRIQDNHTGFLVVAEAAAIGQKIISLKKDTALRQAVHENLLSQTPRSLPEMVDDYQQLWKGRQPQKRAVSYQGLLAPDVKAERLLRLSQKLQQVSQQNNQLQQDLAEKAEWAQGLDRQIQHLTDNLALEKKDKAGLVSQFAKDRSVYEQRTAALSQQIGELQQSVSELNTKVQTTEAELLESHQQNQQLAQQLEQQTEQYTQQLRIITQERDQARDLVDQMMRSRSWRLTRPLRGMARLVRRIKNKTLYRSKQLLGLPKRISNSVKTRGLKASWQLAKSKLARRQPNVSAQAQSLTAEYQPLQLNTSKKPHVSVVIPVYNHFQHSYHCLKSISQINDTTPFEVIVVDDCSDDETQDNISLIQGIRYHRQAQNGGFIRTCNQGAQLARGDYLLFLNNDTEVDNGWLDALVDTFEQHQNVGLAGSQLRYPDGRLQEAGGIVFSDASGWNYGRLESAEQPEVNHVRAVSYCSGASIMVPTALFKQLGYFDERYVPAYYEDTDLAFAVRAAGLRVLYQPRSRVIHFEGISSGTDVSSGVKKYQVVNQQKFAEKWQKALKQQPAPGTAIEQARFQERKPRILIVDACTPTPDQDSGSLRMINIIQILQQLGHQVSFMPENMAYFGDYTAQLQNLGVECVYAPKYSSPVDYLESKGAYFEVVLLSRYYVAQPLLKALKDYAPKAKLWFDTVDLHYLREQRMAELAGEKSALKAAKQTKAKELAVAKACDLTLVVSPYEQSVLAREMPELQVAVLSNIHEIHGRQKSYQQRRDIVFIGGYQHTPNVDGICWFVADIWPQIHARLPDVTLHIVGSKAPDKVAQLGQQPGIKFHGFVEDIAPMMTDIRIAVAPLRFGAGVKGKVNMSMSYGQPVVGTTVAVEGMYTRHGEDVLMADDADEFAREVVRLYQDEDLWMRLSDGGLNNVRQYFSFEAAKNVLADLLQVHSE